MMTYTVKHTPPVTRQTDPSDTGMAEIMHQVREYDASGTLVSTRVAMAIAAWWHAPHNAFSAFSHTGTIEDGLADEITDEIDTYVVTDALYALLAYVHASTVTVWTVGKNTAGYLPESDVHACMEFADAAHAYIDMLKEAPDELTGDEYATDGSECSADGPCTDGGELCEFHALQAHVAAYLADDGPHLLRWSRVR